MVDHVVRFFKAKRSWSKYKDLILDYYLEPYLAKVAKLGRPIAVVDCFAGPGRFDDGSLGSPLIILKHLRKLSQRGIDVRGVFIESHPALFDRLKRNVKEGAALANPLNGSFREFVGQIAELALTHTIFLYVDPIRPGDLLFDDLESVYARLLQGQSVETLVNLQSRTFLRQCQGLRARAAEKGRLSPTRPEVLRCNQIAGGTYWQGIVSDGGLSEEDRVERIAAAYSQQLHKWFIWVLSYPIREKYQHRLPKYHLVFGSRHPDAVDLMNRAMVTARRKFVGATFVEGMLFPNQPREEVPDPHEIRGTVVETAQRVGRVTWALLRVHATIANPCKYLDAEFNRAIKAAIRDGDLLSTCDGTRIENDASVWPKPQA